MKAKLLHALFALTFICHAVYSNAQTGNTKVGTNALLSNTNGDFSTALGYYSLYKNTTGGGNTASGAYSLYNNVGGNSNTASGYASLRNNTSGTGNTASGHSSLNYNTTGAFNTANGNSSLNYNTTGRSNTASGAYSLRNNTAGDTNTASGHSSLYHNTSGNYNTASGAFSLYTNTTGNSNTASGYSSLRSNTTGRSNTASGASSLYKNTNGYNNTASGASSLYNNTNGYGNTASGASSLVNNTTGKGNTAHGYYAMRSNTTGSYNTAVGDSAGAAFNYNNSTFIGYKTAVTVTGLTNVTVIGNLTSATASNQVRIGNNAVSSIGGKVGWTTLSDGRFKKNIKEDVPGLAFISNLRPVTYTVDIDALDKATGVIEEPSTEQITARNAAAQEKHTGFIAQEVEKAANELKYDFGGVDKPKNDKDLYGLRYSEFVVPLVKAVQELSRMNEEKDAKINELETRLLKLETLMNAQHSSSLISKQPINITTATLEQNIPNPFNHTTTIGYTLPQKFASAQIVMMDKNGNIVKQVNVSGSGKASMIIDATTLAAGVYSYSLLVDGKIIGTKQMVFIK